MAAIAKNRPLPEWFLNEPLSFRGDDFFITAFFHLDTCRQMTESGPGPIPWTATVDYADRRGLEPDLSLAFEFIIAEMDKAYRKWFNKKQKALTPKAKKPITKRGRR